MIRPESRPAQAAPRLRRPALVVGALVLSVGVVGFVPGLTNDVDAIEFAGYHSGAMLLGVVQASVRHTIVHLLFDVVGIAPAHTDRAARSYPTGGGARPFAATSASWWPGMTPSSPEPARCTVPGSVRTGRGGHRPEHPERGDPHPARPGC